MSSLIRALFHILLFATSLITGVRSQAPLSTLTLNNSYVSVTWNQQTHALEQFQRVASDGTVTSFLNTGAIASLPDCWWSMYVVSPTLQQPFLVNPYQYGVQQSMKLVQGQGYQNMSFDYNIPVADTTGFVQVHIDAQLEDEATNVQFFMQIRKVVTQPNFPIGLLNATITLQGIDPTQGGGNSDVLVLPSGFGMAFQDPTHTFTDPYPAHYPNSDATYQNMMYYFNSTDPQTNLPNGAGLYIESHDPLGSYKIITYQLSPYASGSFPPTFDLSITVFPLNTGQDLSSSFPLPHTPIAAYPIIWGVFQGDWIDGSANYADWIATSQPAWMASGTMQQRTQTDTPSWLLDMNFWMNTGWQQLDIFNATEGDPAVVLERVQTMMEILDLASPVGLHWYEWDTIKFDTGYPEYFPTKPGFSAAVQQLHQLYGPSLKIAPYINGRIFDTGTASWVNDQAVDFAAKSTPPTYNSTAYSIYQESYGSGATFAVMCPATSYWQSKLNKVVDTLITECGVDGIYIDQIGSSETKPCADPTHGHTISDGISWITGYTDMLEQIQTTIGGPTGNSSFIITESNAESYMADIQIYLTLVAFRINITGWQSLVPVFPRVYGGHYLAMGAEWFLSDLQPDPDVFASKLVWQFMNGAIMGWISLGGTTTVPMMGLYDALTTTISSGGVTTYQYQPELDWLSELDGFRTVAQKYLVNGRRTRDVTFQYTNVKSRQDNTSTMVYSHPHFNELRTAKRPVSSGRASNHHHHPSQSHSHTTTTTLMDPFVYAPIQSSVWLSSDATTVGLFFSCSIDSNAVSYDLTVNNFNLEYYGVPLDSVTQPWTMLEYDSHGSLIGQRHFATGLAINYHTTLNCRQMHYLSLVPTAITSSIAEAR